MGLFFSFFIGSNSPRLDDRPGGGLTRLHLVHRERHHYAQVLLAAQRHDDAVDAGRSGFTPA
jgi:hypothetical protein